MKKTLAITLPLIVMTFSMFAIQSTFASALTVDILVDATRDGGTWWYPQEDPFNPGSPHQGKDLADYLKSLGYLVTELSEGTTIDLDLLNQYDIVIAIGAAGDYSEDEINAYKSYASCGGALLLLTDHHGERCNLLPSFGLDFRGNSVGNNDVDTFATHPITSGVSTLTYGVGSGLISYCSDANIIGWLSEDTFIDLNDNDFQDPGEPSGAPVLGYMYHGAGKIVFFGDVNGAIEAVEQPFTDNYLNWLLFAAPQPVIPEVPLGTVVASAAMIIALAAYIAMPKLRKKQISITP